MHNFGRSSRLLMLAAISLLASGCATQRDRIVLLPNADGSPSAVIVKTAKGEQVIDHPYQEVSVDSRGGFTEAKEAPEEVQKRYGELLAAQPKRPVSFVVYFVSGTNEITPESQEVVEQMKAELKSRAAPEITLIGHTDRVGAVELNDRLSRERAQAMHDILVQSGVQASRFEVVGRGEREPLVPTDDEVDEPRNRRVEINVR